MFNPYHFENSRPGGVAVLEIAAQDRRPGQPRFVPLRDTHLAGRVTGPVANLTVRHTYSFSAADWPTPVEAVYRFPLSGDAAVTSVRVRFGDVAIDCELVARSEAEQSYREALEQGQQAALLTRETPDVFTLRIAGVRPDEEVIVETSYVQLARAEGTGWSLRVPLTTAPRYVRPDETGSRLAQGQPLAIFRDPGHRFALRLTFVGDLSISSTTHEIVVRPTEGGQTVELAASRVVPDRDLVLHWEPVQHAASPGLQVLVEPQETEEAVYFLALITPPKEVPPTPLPREVIVLVDRSGSMTGPKWRAADWALKRFLSGLRDTDWFNIGLFHDEAIWFAPNPRRATPDQVNAALHFVDSDHGTGGTELGVALEQALLQDRRAGELVRHVLIITDAQVTDEARLLQLVDRESLRSDRRRVSLLCIDAAPNSFLVQQLAARGGGTCRFLTSSPHEQDIATALDGLLAEFEQPIYSDLKLELNCSGISAVGAHPVPATAPGWEAVDLGDLAAGRTRWVIGRLPRLAHEGLSVRVVDARGNLLATARGAPAQAAGSLRAVYGAYRLTGLEFLLHATCTSGELKDQLIRLGFPAHSLPDPGEATLYPENQGLSLRRALQELLVAESLRTGIICSETSFIARRQEAGRRVECTVAVGNALPYGWSDYFISSGHTTACLTDLALEEGGEVWQMFLARQSSPPQSSLVHEFSTPDLSRQELTVYQGVPDLTTGWAVLFDSRTADRPTLPDEGYITGLAIQFTGEEPVPATVDPDLELVVYIGDTITPTASIPVRDLLRQGGERPLNLAFAAGDLVRVDMRGASCQWRPEWGKLLVKLLLA